MDPAQIPPSPPVPSKQISTDPFSPVPGDAPVAPQPVKAPEPVVQKWENLPTSPAPSSPPVSQSAVIVDPPMTPTTNVNPAAVLPAQPPPAPTFSPTSPLKKEMAPPSSTVSAPEAKGLDMAEANKIAEQEGDDYWQRYAQEIKIEKEIAEIGGIEKIENGEVPIPPEIAKEMGVKPAITIDTPLEIKPEFTVSRVILSDDQLSTGVKKPTSTGFRWLVEWFIYQLKKAHFLVRSVKGKITRQQVPPTP